MKILILNTIFMIELLKYSIGLSICFQSKRKSIWAVFIGLLLNILISISTKLPDNEIHIIIYSVVIMVLIITVKENISKKILQILMLVFVITCIDELAGIPINMLIKFKENYLYINDLKYLCSSFISLLFLIIIAILKRQDIFMIHVKIMKYLQRRISVIVLIMAIFLLFTIAGLNYAKIYIMNERFALYATIVSIISFISVGLLGVFMIYINRANEKMELLIETERNLMKMNKKYYEALLEKEEDTRRYRHDLNNHLICLNELAQNQKTEVIKDYIEKMQSQINSIQMKCYMVGNEVLDAILNYYLPMLKEDVKISVIGKCTVDIEVNNVDLCTIFSNLIYNAVEEVRIESIGEKYLIVMIKQGVDYSEIVIKNSINREYKCSRENFFKSKKADCRNHGIGLRNVKEAIERNNGIFEIKNENKEIVAKIIFKNESQ